MRQRPLREESRRSSPTVVCADSFETRPDIPLIMSGGLHDGRTDKHMAGTDVVLFVRDDVPQVFDHLEFV